MIWFYDHLNYKIGIIDHFVLIILYSPRESRLITAAWLG